MTAPRWTCGVTTVPERQHTTLPRTLVSLGRAGFPAPRLFVDGMAGGHAHAAGRPATYRFPRVGAWGNWVLALYELYLREPVCERYALFQDDVLAVRNLRAYLDACRYPDGGDGRAPGYWSLYAAQNAEMAIHDLGVWCGWIEGPELVNRVPNDGLQCGRGALGLVFNREAVLALLSSPHLAGKPGSTDRPTHCIDGAVVNAMNLHRSCARTGRAWPKGWREYVHGPSLLAHAGRESTVKGEDGAAFAPGAAVRGPGKRWRAEAEATTFPGEDWSALEMLQRRAG